MGGRAGIAVVAGLLVMLAASCRREQGAAAPPKSKRPTAASLSPAATDLVLGIGAGAHLIAVSNYDKAREGTAGLPRVGDYAGVDWEKVAAIRPDVMVVQGKRDRMPAGLEERAKGMGIKLEVIGIDRIADIFTVIDQLGTALAEREKADAAGAQLHARLDAVKEAARGKPPVTALIVLSENGEGVVGPGNFLDESLTMAGGKNVAAGLGSAYPSVDREKLLAMDPDVIIQLLPEASPQVLETAEQFWRSMDKLKAVKNGRVVRLTDWWVLLPGWHVADLAEKFAGALRPTPVPDGGGS